MSNIDVTKPVYGAPTTESVRDNFQIAAEEIDGLRSDLNALDGQFLKLSGGELTGPLTLVADPVAPLEAATRQYVDNAPPLGGPYLPLSGGPMTGPLTTGGNGITYGNMTGGWPGHAFSFGWNGSQVGVFVDNVFIDAMATAGSYLPLTGGAVTGATTFTNGVGFGSNVGSFSGDLSKHILLYGTTYGLGVTTNRLNYVVDSAGSHVFVANLGDVVTINSGGLTLAAGRALLLSGDPQSALQAATRQYADTKLALTGGTVTGNMTVNGTLSMGGTGATTQANFGNVTATSAAFWISGAVGSGRQFVWTTAGARRWIAGMGVGTEPGANAGGDWFLQRWDDAGTTNLGNALSATRSTGLVTVAGDPTAALGIVTKQYADTKLALAGGTVTGGLIVGAAGAGANLAVGNNTATQSTISLNAAAATNRQLIWATAGVNRWNITLAGTESGSDAGSNLTLFRYNDGGTNLGAALTVNRANGLVVTGAALQVTGNVGFNAAAPLARPSITGSRAANAALASLLTALASYGLITDTTTA